MAWLTILSNLPWSDVIKNAPVVVEGAKKLWNKVGGKASLAPSPVVDEKLEGHLAALQRQVDELHGQMQAAGELIQSLAEQNAQLIVRVETSRRRLLALAVFNIVVAALAVAAWLR